MIMDKIPDFEGIRKSADAPLGIRSPRKADMESPEGSWAGYSCGRSRGKGGFIRNRPRATKSRVREGSSEPDPEQPAIRRGAAGSPPGAVYESTIWKEV